MAPELLGGHRYTSKADVWSLGVMLFETLFNRMPWPAGNIRELGRKI
jgi:serine/threonine protein kinase